MKRAAGLALLAHACAGQSTPSCAVSNLAVDYLPNNIALDEPLPSVSFVASSSARASAQSAYHIQVSRADDGSLTWDSGTVASNRTSNIGFGSSGSVSSQLADDTDYTWSVHSVIGACDASASGSFSTALLVQSSAWDSAQAQWIGGHIPDKANLLRSDFTLPWAPSRARLYLSGLGAHKSFINGRLTDGHQLGPFTQYQRRTPYYAVNVTSLLQQGPNALGIMLGAGRYLHGPGLNVSRTVRFILSVSGSSSGGSSSTIWFTSSTVSASDSPADSIPFTLRLPGRGDAVTVQPLSVLTSLSPVTSDDVFDGQSYVARLEQPGWTVTGFVPPAGALPWLPAIASPLNVSGAPFGGPLMSSIKVPTVIGRTYSTMGPITQPYPGVFVADAGQGMAGYCALRIPVSSCTAGSVVTISYGESLGPDGTVYDCRTSTDSYICAGANATTGNGNGYVTYAPAFSYRGYRWVQVEGYPGGGVLPDDALTCYFLHAGVPSDAAEDGFSGGSSTSRDTVSSGAFASGNTLLNTIQHNVQASALSNLYEVPTGA